METTARAQAVRHGEGPARDVSRVLPAEVAVALSYDGTTQAVMMATPGDLEDLAVGFTLSEGLAAYGEIAGVSVLETPLGLDLQIRLHTGAGARMAARRRTMAGPVGCGLCGIESLEEAMRTPEPMEPDGLVLAPRDILAAVDGLWAHQPLHDATHAAHVAAFWTPKGGVIAAREDVGRHNALDKLIGAMARADTPLSGAVVVSSRISIDLVQKSVRARAPVLVGVSAPTAGAVAMAEAAGLTLIALVRGTQFEVFSRMERIQPKKAAHVA